jgi:hypothetical protein
VEEFSGRDVGLPEYVLETDRFLRIDGVSTVFAISRYFYDRKTAESGTTVSLPYPRNPIRRYCSPTYVHTHVPSPTRYDNNLRSGLHPVSILRVEAQSNSYHCLVFVGHLMGRSQGLRAE